jgi:glycosyltransferase involved in cell wall biosynthesis
MPGRVLVVTYFFPPVGGVGVQRTLKYVTYLPQSGWEPVVLTARNPGALPRDDEAERRLSPDLVVERAFSPEPVKLRRALGRVVRRASSLVPNSPTGPSETNGLIEPAAAGPPRAGPAPRARDYRGFARLWAWMERLIFFPDPEVTWAPFAVFRGLEAHRRSPVDVVYSSAGPFSSHLAAALIATRTGLPWVADFRDPWSGNAFAPPLPALHALLRGRIERRFVHLADRTVFATARLMELYATRYSEVAGRFVTIPNGYDRADLVGIAPADPPRPGGFHLLYAGSLYRAQELEIFLLGVDRLLARRPDLRARLRVDFVGTVNEANARLSAEFERPERLGGIVGFEGFMPRSRTLARMAGADALLQLMPDVPGADLFVGGKLLESLAFDRPILAVMPSGEGRDLVEGLAAGIVADVEPASVADALERLLDRTPAPAPADPEGRYDRANLAARLARVLDGVVEEGRRA